MIQHTLTLKMTSTQVVKTSVTLNNNSPIQDYVHPDDHTQPTYGMTPGLKTFTIPIIIIIIIIIILLLLLLLFPLSLLLLLLILLLSLNYYYRCYYYYYYCYYSWGPSHFICIHIYYNYANAPVFMY